MLDLAPMGKRFWHPGQAAGVVLVSTAPIHDSSGANVSAPCHCTGVTPGGCSRSCLCPRSLCGTPSSKSSLRRVPPSLPPPTAPALGRCPNASSPLGAPAGVGRASAMQTPVRTPDLFLALLSRLGSSIKSRLRHSKA